MATGTLEVEGVGSRVRVPLCASLAHCDGSRGANPRAPACTKNRASTRERAKAYLQGVADALLLPKVARQITERYRSEFRATGTTSTTSTKRRRGDSGDLLRPGD